MRPIVLFKFFSIASIGVLFIYIYSLYQQPPLPPVTSPDQCVSCHKNFGSIDTAHPVEIFGCAKCHGGNAYSSDKTVAHENMVLNPSRLENVDRFCSECHQEVTSRIKMSLMESQNGIQNVLKEQWAHKSIGLDPKKGEELAANHFDKACASCHINQDEKIFDPRYAKGGGCSDCHRVGTLEKKPKLHPRYTTQISSDNCLKCHNRSNRIGLAYFGKFESEGYGTPYHDGNFTHQLDGSRFYYDLPADVHHEKAELDCIDCHTEVGVMGDGKAHKNMEDAVDVTCKDCHKPTFKEFLPNTLASKLLDLNKKVPEPQKIAFTNKKNSPLYNLQKNDTNITFYRKKDAKEFNLTGMSDAPYHTLDIHKRLDCSACHAQWIPSCYGCHEVYFEKGEQLNWRTKEKSKGAWMELRSFLRFEAPSLGVGYNEKIMPFAPGCQVIGTLFEDKKVEQFHAMAMAGWEPHTTGKARECVDCHFNPASLGLGRGNFDVKKGEIYFEPFYDSNRSGMPFSYPIDGFVSKEGKQFQTTSREKARSFNQEELHKVVNAYECILCHRSYDDPIYKDFKNSKERFDKGVTPCLK